MASDRELHAGDDRPAAGSRPVRLVWFCVGIVAVGLGLVGVVVPGLPTTGFMVLAAAAFSRSSPRLEAWVLSLPKVGPAVRDYRAGLGMPRRAKVGALTMMWVAIGVSSVLVDSWAVRPVLVAAGVIGSIVILRVPTRREPVRPWTPAETCD